MKLLIFEGVATSGKSTIENELGKICEANNKTFILYHEDQTVIPLMGDRTVESSIALLNKILDEFKRENHDVVIVDRFYLTHFERTKALHEVYEGIRHELRDLGATIIFLKLSEDKIRERLTDAMGRRSKKFVDYINERGGIEPNVQKYIKQQKSLLESLEKADIPFEIYDTSDMQFSIIARQIFNKFVEY